MKTLYGFVIVSMLLALGWLYIDAEPNQSTPSEEALFGDVPLEFLGSVATARPVQEALTEPELQHPHLAPAGVNSMHNDSGQRDNYRWAGPLGRDMVVHSRQFHRLGGSCVAQSFTRSGHMVGTCVSAFGVTLVARDPHSLDVLARQVITRWLPIGAKFSGGVYFHLDAQDRVLLATNDQQVQFWSLREEDNEFHWELDKALSLSPVLSKAGESRHRIIDVMPDWEGNYWFITRAGLVGVVGPDGTGGAMVTLGDAASPAGREGIDNALAVGEKGVFVVSSHAMYRFARAQDGSVKTLWRAVYDRGSAPKKGTMGYGSGTTPTLVANDYVAITDNADGQINVMVYAQDQREEGQTVCKIPVFPADRGTSENSLAVVGRGLIVENNFAYSGPRNVPDSEPGLARVDIRTNGDGCDLVWENLDIASPSAVPKVSLATGLVYLYTRDDSNPTDLHAWYFTAVDVRTGEVVYKQLTGVGWLFNNHYGSITIAPDGTAYVGIMGGLVSLRDSPL